MVALLGLLVALGAGGAMKFMGGGTGSTSSVVPAQSPAVLRAKRVAAAASARAKHLKAATASPAKTTHKVAAAKPKHVAATPKPAVKPVPKAKQVPTATRVSPALAAGLPLPLAQALSMSPTVVVALYNPESEVDGIAFAEARAGAALAGAAFVGLNVLSQAQVGKLTEQIGLLPDPSVLVFTRPANLATRIDGFVDKETVAQAAQNAAHRS